LDAVCLIFKHVRQGTPLGCILSAVSRLSCVQNSFDGNANFIIFDLSEHDVTGPKVMTLPAAVEVTAILDNQEAVTGTFAGELIVWSLRTGKVCRVLPF